MFSALICIPLASVFWTLSPVMLSVGPRPGGAPTLRRVVPDTLLIAPADVFDAFSVPSTVSVVAVAIARVPAADSVSTPFGYTDRPFDIVWVAAPLTTFPSTISETRARRERIAERVRGAGGPVTRVQRRHFRPRQGAVVEPDIVDAAVQVVLARPRPVAPDDRVPVAFHTVACVVGPYTVPFTYKCMLVVDALYVAHRWYQLPAVGVPSASRRRCPACRWCCWSAPC